MKEFPPRIFALIKTASEKGWEDGDGMTYVDDADAAIAWIESAQSATPVTQQYRTRMTPNNEWSHWKFYGAKADLSFADWVEVEYRDLYAMPVHMIFSDADQRDLNIGRAIQRAAMELPETCSINIELSLGSGSVVWFDEDDHGECSESGEQFSAQIHAAIDAAIASVSPK